MLSFVEVRINVLNIFGVDNFSDLLNETIFYEFDIILMEMGELSQFVDLKMNLSKTKITSIRNTNVDFDLNYLKVN